MNENLTISDTESMQEQFESSSPLSAGQMLKKARLDAGLHIAALAVSLRVPVKRIEALENGQMDQLPDMVFVRALTSSISQALKIDPVPILEKLPKAALPRLNRDDIAINTPIGASGSANESVLFGLFTSPWFLGVVMLCIGAAGIYLWPKANGLAATEMTSMPKALPDAGVTQAKGIQVTTDGNTTTNLVASPSLGIVKLASDDIKTEAKSSAIAVPAAPSLTPVPEVTTSTAALISDKLVSFKATGQTWVEVKNAAGATVFKKLLNEGESAATTGTTPLTVIVGRADVTQVEVRGKAVNLAPISKSNVARFEVN